MNCMSLQIFSVEDFLNWAQKGRSGIFVRKVCFIVFVSYIQMKNI